VGTFRVAVEIGDAAGERWETVEALVDTGATYTTVPAALLRRLGVTPHVRDTFVLAVGLWTLVQRWRNPVPGYDSLPPRQRTLIALAYAVLVTGLVATLSVGS